MSVERVRVEFTGGEEAYILPPGTRVRAKADPTLHGTIHHWEYHQSGAVSPIPYRVEWDNHDRAYRVLGFLCIYASDNGVEPIE